MLRTGDVRATKAHPIRGTAGVRRSRQGCPADARSAYGRHPWRTAPTTGTGTARSVCRLLLTIWSASLGHRGVDHSVGGVARRRTHSLDACSAKIGCLERSFQAKAEKFWCDVFCEVVCTCEDRFHPHHSSWIGSIATRTFRSMFSSVDIPGIACSWKNYFRHATEVPWTPPTSS